MAEKKISKEIVTNEAGDPTGVIRWTYPDKSVTEFDLAKCPEPIKLRLALHGASQKGGDSYAGAAGETDPIAFAKAQVEGVIAQLYAGDWRATVSAGPRVSDLAVAIARATGENLEGDDGAIAMVTAMNEDEKKAWRKKPKVAAELAKLAAERAIAKANQMVAKAAEAEEKEKAAATATA